MQHFKILAAGFGLAALLGTVAASDNHADEAMMRAVKARQAQMQLYAFNLGTLGAMAKGEADYNADAASAAAGNLAKLSSLNAMAQWPAGSDTESLGREATGALPAIWAEGSDVGSKAKALSDAAAAMDAVAGQGIDALRGAIGPVGASCGGCHKVYRQSDS